jgi:hypothetical protein
MCAPCLHPSCLVHACFLHSTSHSTIEKLCARVSFQNVQHHLTHHRLFKSHVLVATFDTLTSHQELGAKLMLPPPLCRAPIPFAYTDAHTPGGRIIVAYLSTDYGQTVMLSFMAEALVRHTRSRGAKVRGRCAAHAESEPGHTPWEASNLAIPSLW